MDKRINWLRYVLILLTALIVLWIVQKREKQFEARTIPVFDFAKEDIHGFTLTRGIEKVTIGLSDTVWVFVEPDSGWVDQEKVERFLNVITQMNRGNFLSSNPEFYTQYNITEQRAFRLILTDKNRDVLGDMFVGISNTSHLRDNIRYAPDPNVYQVDLKLSRELFPYPEYWLEE